MVTSRPALERTVRTPQPSAPNATDRSASSTRRPSTAVTSARKQYPPAGPLEPSPLLRLHIRHARNRNSAILSYVWGERMLDAEFRHLAKASPKRSCASHWSRSVGVIAGRRPGVFLALPEILGMGTPIRGARWSAAEDVARNQRRATCGEHRMLRPKPGCRLRAYYGDIRRPSRTAAAASSNRRATSVRPVSGGRDAGVADLGICHQHQRAPMVAPRGSHRPVKQEEEEVHADG